MKFRHFLNVLQNSWNLQNLLNSPPETCMWNLRQFGEVTIFDRKMLTALDLQNSMKFWHFLNVLQNSWNLQNLLESPPETCMWNLRQFGEVTIFERKMPTAPDLQNRMKFWHFLNVLQNSWHLQNLLKSPPETCMWNLRQFGEVTIFDRKMPTAPDLQNRMEFWHFLNVLQNSRNLQKLLESPPETCMWNLRQFGEVTIFDGKCRQRRTFKTGWNFDIFSMFSKIHETYRIYWNHHQKHACEIWGSSEKLQFLTEKCLQRQTFNTGWNFDIFSMFSKIHDTYRSYWNHHQKHACEIWGSSEKLQFLMEKCLQRRTLKTVWNLDIFSMFSKIHETYRIYWTHHQKHACEIWGSSEKLQFLTEKCWQRLTFKIRWNFDIFSMSSKIHETYRIYWNHHQKHACEIWGSLEKLQFLTEKCIQRRTLKTGWNFDIFSMFSKTHETYRIYWNHHQKHTCEIWGSLEKLQFFTEKCLQRRTFKIGWNFDIFSMFSKIHETYRIYWNHHQKHACEIWGISEKLQFLMVKCLQPRTLKTVWNFEIFSMFSKIHDTYRIYWNHHQKHAYEIWGSLGKLQFLTEKCLQRRTFKTGWNFEIFSMFSKIHDTYRIYWNHHQKHACEIWGSLEKLQFLTEKCLQRQTLKTGWNLDIFSMFPKIHETYRIYWNHHQKHACEIWRSLEKLQFLREKCLQRRTFKIGWNFDIFSMFSKIHETYRNFWNHHQKHACEIWGGSEKLQFLTEKCLQRRTFKTGWIVTFSQCSPKFMTLTEVIGITTRNMHVKFEAVLRSYNFWRKNAYSAGPSKQDEI